MGTYWGNSQYILTLPMPSKLLAFTATVVRKPLVFKATADVGRGRWKQTSHNTTELSLLTELLTFVCVNSPWTVVRVWLISRVLKRLIVLPMFLLLWSSGFTEILTLSLQKCYHSGGYFKIQLINQFFKMISLIILAASIHQVL